MPRRPTERPTQIIQGAPLLEVPDVKRAADYYRDILGFQSDPEGTSDEYTVVWRDNAAIHLARGERPVSGVRVFFWVEDVNALHEEVLSRGAEITVPIGTRPYRIRDFSVCDPNGVDLVFGQDWD